MFREYVKMEPKYSNLSSLCHFIVLFLAVPFSEKTVKSLYSF